MKINKIRLAISHFFGYRKGEEHFTDTKTYKRVKVAIRNWKLETLDV